MKLPDQIIADFKWSVDQLDFDVDSDADLITKSLIGKCSYWKDYPRTNPLKIEIAILRKAGWRNWGGKSKFGKPFYQHLLAVIKLMMPKSDIHPTLADSAKMFCEVVGNGLKGFHMIGSQNSSKSATSVRISFAVMAIFPKESAIYFANPFDSAADSTIWGEVEECFDEISLSAPWLFPDSVKYALKKIDLVPGMPKAGTMEIRNVKSVGKLKGAKTRKTGEVEGLIVVNIDEVNEIYNHAFIKMLSNLISQDGFVVQTSQNFKNPEDMGGRMTEPVGKYGGPSGFKDLTEEADHIWYSFGSSITMRFSGKRSPNIIADRAIYPYLFTAENHKLLIEIYGDKSPEYYSQCLSFPMESDEATSVLSKSRINLSRHDDPYYQIKGEMTSVAFCDPSFGGGDLAAYILLDFGTITYLDSHSVEHSCEAIIVKGSIQYLNVRRDMTVDNEILRRIATIGGDTSRFEEGNHFPPEYQVSLQCAEKNRKNGIPEHNFGYDFSMRPDIVVSMGMLCGPKSIPFDYNTKPLGYQIKSLMASSEDACRMRSDELAFITSDLFANQRIRNGSMIPAAILQLSRTRYEIRNEKRIIDKKRDFKARWNNQSPDDRDALMGGVGMCYLRGFRVASLEDQKRREDTRRAYRPRIKSSKFKRRTGKRISFN